MLEFRKIKVFYTISVFIALAAFDNIVIGLFPPLFSSISKDLNVHISTLGMVSALNIIVTAFSSILWGYLAGRGKRKRLIIIGTVIWAISVFLTSRSSNILQLFIYQFFTGIGLGCIASIGYSVINDYTPSKYRGTVMSLWGMSQGLGGISGSLMASLVATAVNWRKPFEIVSFIGIGLIFLYFFVKEPKIGQSDPELKDLIKQGFEYNYKIEFSHLFEIVSKQSNIWLFFQGFFMNITTGTLIWLPTLYIAKIEHQGFSTHTAIIASGYLFALLQTGGLTSTYFGYLGDKLQTRTYRGRALLTSALLAIAVPLYTAMFLIPMNHLELPDNGNPIFIFISLVKSLITNPWMFTIFILAFLATAAQSSNTPNWLALITEANLPEHRSTVFSTANLINGFGRTIGNIGVGFLLAIISKYSAEPNTYIITLIVFQFFFLPAAFCYIKMSKNNSHDIKMVKSTLRKRTNAD